MLGELVKGKRFPSKRVVADSIYGWSAVFVDTVESSGSKEHQNFFWYRRRVSEGTEGPREQVFFSSAPPLVQGCPLLFGSVAFAGP